MSNESGIALEDLELLAAFIDGRLSGDEKRNVEARLLDDRHLYELYVETLRSLDEVPDAGGSTARSYDEVEADAADSEEESGVSGNDEPPGAQVVEHPASARWRRMAAIAGLAAAAMLAIAVLPRIFTPSPGDPMVAMLAGDGLTAGDRFGDNWTDPGWSRTRSGGTDLADRIGSSAVAARLGIRSVDLEVALLSAPNQAAGVLARELALLADASGVSAAAQVFQTVAVDLEEGAITTDEALEIAARGSELLAEGLEASSRRAEFDLGRWAEIGRLASLARDDDLLESSAFLGAAAVDRSGLPEPVTLALDLTLAHMDSPESDAELLRPDFAALVRAIAG